MPTNPMENVVLPCRKARARCREVGFIASHAPREWRSKRRTGALASTYVCADPDHQHAAKVWVYAMTGRPGKFYPFPPEVQERADRQRRGRRRGAR